MRLRLPAIDLDHARERLAALPGDGPIVALIPGASIDRKQWAPDRYAALARALHDEIGARFALIGGPSDAPAAEAIARDARFPLRSFCGTAGLRESAALLGACDLAVGGDTGPLHLAVAAGTPVVALYGSSEPHETGPFSAEGELVFLGLPCCGCPTRVPCPIGTRCMADLTVDMVLAAARRAMSERAPVPMLTNPLATAR